MSHVAADSRGVVQRMTNATPQIQLTYIMPSACIIMLESAQAPVSRELDALDQSFLLQPCITPVGRWLFGSPVCCFPMGDFQNRGIL